MVDVDVALVRALLESQHPHLAGPDLRLVDRGLDNVTFRLGEHLAVRLPRREIAAELIAHELRWLPVIAAWLPVEVPVPVARGEPDARFPYPWSVVRWLDGTVADREPLAPAEAVRLATTLRALHRPPDDHAPVNPFRGGPREARRDVVEARLHRLERPALLRAWHTGLDAPRADTAVWIHGDLHSRNVIVKGDALVGIIDWGDAAVGDRATDLACAWLLFDAAGRDAFLREYGPAASEVARARAWAALIVSAMLDSHDDTYHHLGATLVDRLEA